MIKMSDLKIDTKCFGGEYLLVDIVPSYDYKDGKKTNNLLCYKYEVALPKFKMEKLSVKIPSNVAPIVDIDNNEEIPMKNVIFEGLEIGCYMSDRFVNLTATAKSVSFVK